MDKELQCIRDFTFIAVILAAIFFLTSNIGYSDNINPGIYSTNSSVEGASYQEWVARWWNWTAGIPREQHPQNTYECDVHQSGKVWFLPDTLQGVAEATCVVQNGTAIFIPVVTGEMSVAEDNSLKSITDPLLLRRSLEDKSKNCDNYAHDMEVWIGQNKLKGFEGNAPLYRTNSSAIFNITWVKDNNYNVKVDPSLEALPPSPAFAEGWFLFLEPLTSNETIRLKSDINHPDPIEAANCDTHPDVTWHLAVQ